MSERQTRVFISYSRTDSAFVGELLKGLKLAGYEAIFDRDDILGGEMWKTRLVAMVSECDIFCPVLTPSWTNSSTCIWEAEQARDNAKRILPIMLTAPGDTPPPSWIAALNYVRFDEGGSDTDKYLALADALQSDVEWYRASSALLLRAQSWQGGAAEIVLRGNEITEAQALLNDRPPGAPEPTKLQLDFLADSESAERLREDITRQKLAKERKLLLRVRYGLMAFALALLVAGTFIFQQKQQLRAAELRLDEGLALTIADTQRKVVADPRWIRLATEHKLAFAIIYEGNGDGPGRRKGSGFLVPGGVFSSDWEDKTVLMTAGHLISRFIEDPSIERLRQSFRAEFPAHKTGTLHEISEVLFWSPIDELDVAILSLNGPIPNFATTIWPTTLQAINSPVPREAGGIGVLQWNAERNYTLGFGHRIDVDLTADWAKNALTYTDITGPGASGAPVFDMDTSNLICLHQRAAQIPNGSDRFGACTSIVAILDEVRSKLH